MCGLGGYYCWGDARPSSAIIKNLLITNQARGRSAAGIAYLDSAGKIVYRKQKGPAEALVAGLKPQTWDEIAASPRAMIHARATTKGTEEDNVNNHPVSGLGWLAVHNGYVVNDDELFEYYKAKRFAEVDTAAVPLVLSQGSDYFDALRYLSLLAGSVSASVWSVKNPEHIAIFRLGPNEVWLFLDEKHEILYWSSAAEAIRHLPGTSLGPLQLRTVRQVPEGKIIVLSPEGREATRLFEVTRSPFLPAWVVGRRGGTKSRTGSMDSKKNTTFSFTPAKIEGRPTPCWDDVIHNWMILGIEVNAFSQQKALVGKTLQTPYGRWVFTRGGGLTIERDFLPQKRVKKYWYKELKKIPVFPAQMTEEQTTIYDDMLPLEHYTLKESLLAGQEMQTMGLVCPWCGVIGRRVGWDTRQLRCDFCNIRSKPPEE